MLIRPYPVARRFILLTSAVTMRAPVAATGCPTAMELPSGLSLFTSTECTARFKADWPLSAAPALPKGVLAPPLMATRVDGLLLIAFFYSDSTRRPQSYTVMGPSCDTVMARQLSSALILAALLCRAPLPSPISARVSAAGRNSTIQPLNLP